MKNMFILLGFAVSVHMNLAADSDIAPQKAEQTFIQEYSCYSITLSEDWKLVGDETDVVPIPKVSGLYRYAPGSKKEITSAEWAYLGKPGMRLGITMSICPPQFGIGKVMQDMKFEIVNKIIVEDKGTFQIQDKEAKWWIGKYSDGVSSYIFFIGRSNKFYIVEFLAADMNPETRLKCTQIMKTFTFLN